MRVKILLMSPIEKSNTIRVAFYARVSTDEQAKEGYGIDMQLDGLNDMMEYKGRHHDWIHDSKYVYKDLWFSGWDLNRPEYKRMMQDMKEGKFDMIAVWKIDRLSRNLSHLLNSFEEMQKYRVSFYSLKENIDFSWPIGKLTFQIFGALAEFERETIKMRTKEWKIASARLWNYVLNSAPYGYKKQDREQIKRNRTLVIDTEQAEWVRKVFSEFIYWKNYEQLAKMMNEHKVRKSAFWLRKALDTKWYPKKIREMLEDTTYTGRAEYRQKEDDGTETVVPLFVPQIIADLDFELAQNRIEDTSREIKRWWWERAYILSRKIIDMETGRKFVWVPRTKWGHSYRRKEITINDVRYPNREMPGEALEEHVWDIVRESIDNPGDLFEIYQIQSLNADDYERLVRERDFHQKEIEKYDNQENTVHLDYYDWKISEERRDTLSQRYTEKKNAHTKSIIKLDEDINKIIKTQATKHALDSFAKDIQTNLDEITNAQKQFLIDLAVDRVEVTWTKSHPVVNVVLRFKPTQKNDDDWEVEPEKSSDKPKKGLSKLISIEYGRNRMKGYIRMGVYSKIKKEQHWRITKTQFTPLTREEMDTFRIEKQSMQLIQVGETIENLITEEVSPISTI